jgi:hypothetical protein
LVLGSFDGVCAIDLNTPFSGTYTPAGVDLTATPVVSVMLEFHKYVLLDEARRPAIVAALLSLANSLNARCS